MAHRSEARRHRLLLRLLILLTLVLGANYIAWRWLDSVNWSAWWIAVPLVLAETYSLIDCLLFGLTMWRLREREAPPAAPPGLTVDVFITSYNEPVDLVMATAAAAQQISYPHRTWILDDGDRSAMRERAVDAGIGYVTRTDEWAGHQRHAKAGNLNNALMQTEGEFILILDADQVPDRLILDRTLGYFADPTVALVQTPQFFTNVTDADPLGSQAPLFYGPIQQGKDGWNAAFFCGSNAILRREALMQIGIREYVEQVEQRVRAVLRTADSVVTRARRTTRDAGTEVGQVLDRVRAAARTASARLAESESVGQVTFEFQAAVDDAVRKLVTADLDRLRADLSELDPVSAGYGSSAAGSVDPQTLDRLTRGEFSPLAALESVQALVRAVNVDRPDEAQPVMPMATISVTEDMATAMRLHTAGWRTVYHHEDLAHGLAPEDLATMLTQRLRWAQGTLQVLLRENPLVQRGLSAGQRLMYFATMWSYLSGFAAVVYLVAPMVFLWFGILPVHAYSVDFFGRFLPFLAINQLLFVVAARGIRTWRGQQYSIALFPVWIRACVTAVGNVVLGRSLGFAVTPKTRQQVSGQWRLIWPQLAMIVMLIVSAVIGIVRLVLGLAAPAGTTVNLVWVAFDLLILSVIVQAARYRGYPEELVDQ